eukprot:4189424-Amphidinium_carterae.1
MQPNPLERTKHTEPLEHVKTSNAKKWNGLKLKQSLWASGVVGWTNIVSVSMQHECNGDPANQCEGKASFTTNEEQPLKARAFFCSATPQDQMENQNLASQKVFYVPRGASQKVFSSQVILSLLQWEPHNSTRNFRIVLSKAVLDS